VFGLTVVEDDDDHEEDSPSSATSDLDPEISDELILEQDADTNSDETEDEKPSNLLATATGMQNSSSLASA
jgi:hypothetical protein